jgi:septum formation protein
LPSSEKAREVCLVLASASPRRRQILESLGLSFRVAPAEVDETPRPGEPAPELVVRLAREKAARIAAAEELPVLGADTEVVLDGRVLGKPRSPGDARDMLGLLQGRTHEVLTGVCLIAGGRAWTGLSRTAVTFSSLSPEEIAAYVATGEPTGKAGSYHIEGRGGAFIEAVSGSPSSVAGLPAHLVRSLLLQAGLWGGDA